MKTLLPEDPPGWRIDRTDDGRWRPCRIADGRTLGDYTTKREAVDAAIDQDGGA